MNRSELLQQDIAGIQAFLDEFGPCANREPRVAAVSRTGELLTVRNFPLPYGFEPDHVDILLVIPDYPGHPPIGLYMLNRNNAALMRRIENILNLFRNMAMHSAPAIQGYTWICYHYAGQSWRFNARHPAAGDNLRKVLLSFYSICEQEAH